MNALLLTLLLSLAPAAPAPATASVGGGLKRPWTPPYALASAPAAVSAADLVKVHRV
jgi:hypothetical protein